MGLVRSVKKHWIRWMMVFAVIAVGAGTLLYFNLVSAAFQGNGGDVSWGDTTLGRYRTSAYTFGAPGTFGTTFRPATAPSASAIQFLQTKSSPTRTEKLVGYQLNNGRLYIAKCASTCSATANVTDNLVPTWTPSGNPSQAPTIVATNTITRAFDLAYEQQSGRAIVVYPAIINGTPVTGKLYYCIYDGTSWGPVSNCTPTAGVNEIGLSDGTTTLTGNPEWVRLVPRGEQMPDTRSNEMLLAVEDSNQDTMVIRWNGTSWDSTDRQVLSTTGGATITTTPGTTPDGMSFDVGWENISGMEMAVYADGTAFKYRTSTGTGFGAASTIATYGSAAQWARIASDTHSNRISLITAFGSTTAGSTATATPYIWKTNGTTAGWTTYTTLTMAQDAGSNISTVWLKSHAVAGVVTPQALFSASANANNTQPDWSSWVPTTFTAWAALATTTADIIVHNEMTASPNSDIVNMMQANRDSRLQARTYSGTAWGTLISTNLPSTTMINTTTTRTTNQSYIQKPFQFTFKPYAAWSTNWRIYDDESATGNPSTALAPEGVTPQVAPGNTVRLRMAFSELGGASEASVRKKLQYSSGAGCPDSNSCTWTDVDPAGTGGAIWRYSTSGGLADDTAVPSVTLTGATAVGYSTTNGTAAMASGDIHNTGAVQEYDYTIQNNTAVVGTTYYFRAYDFGPSYSGSTIVNLNPILRQQILNSSGTEATNCSANGTPSVCTYPSIQSFTSAPQTPIIYIPVNGDTTNIAPQISLRTSDQQADDVQYVIEWCPTNVWPCASGGGSFDETTSGTGWLNQDGSAASGQSFKTSAVAEAISTMAKYQVIISASSSVFQPNTTYYLRAKAIDPAGSNTYSSYSTIVSFTTSSSDVRINGGTTINGGTIIQ